jgi:phage shock protein A
VKSTVFLFQWKLFKGNETFTKNRQYNVVLFLLWEGLKTMSMFSRIKEMMENKMDDLWDKTDDLEKMIEQNLRDLNRDLGKVKAEMASVLAEEQRLKRELNECQEGIDKMERYSIKALDEGNEEDVRRFQDKKLVMTAKLSDLQAAYQFASSKSQEMNPILDNLVADIRELESIKRNEF